ncbi:unnamed protein product, partial [Urochloa humidicola]
HRHRCHVFSRREGSWDLGEGAPRGGGASCWSAGNLGCSFRTLRRSFRDDPIWQDAEQQNPSTRVCTHGSMRAAADPIGGSRCSLGTAQRTTLCSATVATSRSGDPPAGEGVRSRWQAAGTLMRLSFLCLLQSHSRSTTRTSVEWGAALSGDAEHFSFAINIVNEAGKMKCAPKSFSHKEVK